MHARHLIGTHDRHLVGAWHECMPLGIHASMTLDNHVLAYVVVTFHTTVYVSYLSNLKILKNICLI